MRKSLPKSSLLILLLLAACVCGRATAFAQQPATAPPPPAASPTPQPDADECGTAQADSAPAPLTAGKKMNCAFHAAFLSPMGYASTAIGATITEARERHQPQKMTNDRIADGFSRFAISTATRTTGIMLGSGLYPVIFKQDPRYRYSGKQGFGPRTLYAVGRVFVTDGDNGRLQPNYSGLAGNITTSALANIWERNTPGARRIGGRPTLQRFGSSIGFGMLSNIVFKEFWPDIKKIFKL